ncbi:MAG: hypothetical protein KGZ69_01765 [Methylomonas sp.]|nr:hypothetical protein [Methylomonas sp.]
MTSKLKLSINLEPYTCISTTIGELCIFSITVGNQIELHSDLGKPISECDPIEYVKNLTRYICFPKNVLINGKYKPEKPILTSKDVDCLTNYDLEQISKSYIQNNEYLTKELILKRKENEEKTISSEYGDVKLPQGDGESFIDYLTRAARIYDEKQMSRFDNIYSSFPKITAFSSPLEGGINNISSLGQSIRKTLDGIYPSHSTLNTLKTPDINIADLEKSITDSARKNEERRLAPFNELNFRLDQLLDASSQTVNFLVSANEINTRIAEEIKSSSDESTKLTKQNIRLTVFVITLTTISVITPIYTFHASNSDSNIQDEKNHRYVEILSNELIEINKTIGYSNSALQSENEMLKIKSKQQETEVMELNIKIEHQDKRLKELETRLKRSNSHLPKSQPRSGRGDGITPVTSPTPPDMRFSASGG